MRVSSHDFFKGLNVNSTHYFKQFKRIGVLSRFFFTTDDLITIKDNLPVVRYKSAKVVDRATELLRDNSHVAKV